MWLCNCYLLARQLCACPQPVRPRVVALGVQLCHTVAHSQFLCQHLESCSRSCSAKAPHKCCHHPAFVSPALCTLAMPGEHKVHQADLCIMLQVAIQQQTFPGKSVWWCIKPKIRVRLAEPQKTTGIHLMLMDEWRLPLISSSARDAACSCSTISLPTSGCDGSTPACCFG